MLIYSTFFLCKRDVLISKFFSDITSENELRTKYLFFMKKYHPDLSKNE